MDHLNICLTATIRWPFKEILVEKGFTCTGWAISDPYVRINEANSSFYSFREVKGQKFVYFQFPHLAALRLVPKEAVVPFIISVAK